MSDAVETSKGAAKLPGRKSDTPKSDTPKGDTPKSETSKQDTIIDNAQGYLSASEDELAEAYEGFKNLEDVKLAVADGFPPKVALRLESEGRDRKPVIAYLKNIARSFEKDSKLRSAAEVAESRYAHVTGKDLVDTLRQGEVMFQRERVENPAIPLDAGAIIDFPRELIYKWVPAPPKNRSFTPDEHANLEALLRKGWRFYSPDLMRTAPNMRGLPWKLGWESDGDKVRWQDQWLMIRFRDQEMHDRARAIARSNSKGKEGLGKQRGVDARGEEYDYVVHSTGVESTVDKVLRERPDALDDMDQEFPGL